MCKCGISYFSYISLIIHTQILILIFMYHGYVLPQSIGKFMKNSDEDLSRVALLPGL